MRVTEMLIAGSTKHAPIGFEMACDVASIDPFALAFAETPGLYVMEIEPEHLDACRSLADELHVLGTLNSSGSLVWSQQSVDENVEELASIWRSPLNWSQADPQLV